ncbi:MAG: class I SAM-dependent methyltransferase [Cyclobacteriaceae bacterium]
MQTYKDLNRILGNADIYLIDQILKGRFEPGMKILDAGCGEGRNLFYFIQNGFNVAGIDVQTPAIQMLRFTARSLNSNFDTSQFVTGKIESLPWPEQHFDVVICSAVLHFAESRSHFFTMFAELVRVLKPGGVLFIRMTSDLGLKQQPEKADEWRYHLPDGSVRFLLNKKLLQELLTIHNLSNIEPVKTVLVEDQRCMTTLVLQHA